MNIVSFSTREAEPRPGFLIGAGVLPADAVYGVGAPATVPELLADWHDIREKVARATSVPDLPFLPRSEVRLHAPVGSGALLLCVGGNYRSHLEEVGEALPERAPSFVKSPNAVVGPADDIVLPTAFPDMVDFEGELCVVFGRDCHGVTADEASDYIAGYTIMNDVSARDQMGAMLHATTPAEGRWSVIEMLMGKQLPTFAPLGPTILTADAVPDPADLRLQTRLNGQLMQDAGIAELAVGIPRLVEEMSRYYRFAPGDVMSTGTPAGTGAGQKPPRYLRPGDEVAIEVPGIGTLTNRVAPAAG